MKENSGMNIFGSGINNNVNQQLNNTMLNTGMPDVSGEQTANSQILKAAVGDMFRGQILDIKNNMVSISIEGKGVLNARMLDSVSLNIGDDISFLIQENDGAQVAIKPQPDLSGSAKDNAIFKVLEGNGLMPTEKNYRIAESLMSKGLPVDKGHMQKLMQQSYKFPEASIDTLTTLNKLGIEVNGTNIKQFQDYTRNEHQLANDLKQLTAELTDNFTKTILDMPSSDGNAAAIIDKAMVIAGIISDEADMPSASVTDITVSAEYMEQLQAGNAGTAELDAAKLNTAELEQLSAKLSEKTGLKTDVSDVLAKLSDMGFDKQAISELVKESDTPAKLLNSINKVIEGNKDSIPVELIKDLFTSDGYAAILKQTTQKKFSIDVKDMKEPKEIDELYEKIYEKTNKLLDTLSSNQGNTSDQSLGSQAKSVQERIDFMQSLNNMYAYAQLPVKVDGSDMNSELFVYMNKKAIKDAKEAVSALLHLDMEHLGATDVHVSLHGTTVHTKFYVDDETSARIIDEHMTMLEKAINETGYSLTNDVITREAVAGKINNMVVDEMLGNDLEQSVKRYSFDIRM